MKLFIQILFLLLTWFTSIANATPVFTKVAWPSYVLSFSKTENVKEENLVKIGTQNFARSGLEENLFSQKSTSRESYALVGASHAGECKVVNGAGNLWKSFLDDAFTLQKRADVIADGLPAQFPNLSIDELTAIKVYTSDQMRNGSKIYQTLNTELRAGNLSDYNKGLNDLVNSGLGKLTPHSGSTVFRGCGQAESQLAKTWKVGDDITFKDFKSTSISDDIAEKFMSKGNGDVIYEIANPKGFRTCLRIF